MTSNTENMPPPRSGRRLFFEQILRTFSSNKLTGLGAAIFLLVVLAAILAPQLSSHDPIAQHILDRLKGPSATFQRRCVRSSSGYYPTFNLPMGRSLGFASTPCDSTPV